MCFQVLPRTDYLSIANSDFRVGNDAEDIYYLAPAKATFAKAE